MNYGEMGKAFCTGWKRKRVVKGLSACVSVTASVVLVGLSDQYQW